MNVGDILLVAYLEGKLDPDTARAVEVAAETDAAVHSANVEAARLILNIAVIPLCSIRGRECPSIPSPRGQAHQTPSDLGVGATHGDANTWGRQEGPNRPESATRMQARSGMVNALHWT